MTQFEEYLQNGWALTPVRRGTKKPHLTGWQLQDNSIHSVNDAYKIEESAGLLLAHCDPPFMTLDVDDFLGAKKWLNKRGVDLAALLLADTVQISSGRSNRAKLLYTMDKPRLTHKIIEAAKTILEFRCADRNGGSVQDVLPPSIHPDTLQPYTWKGDWHCVPEAPSSLLAIWDEISSPPKRIQSLDVGVDVPACTADELRQTLSRLDPNPESQWWQVLAICTTTGLPGVKEIARKWSRGSTKHTDREFDQKWEHALSRANRDDNLSYGTLVWMARKHAPSLDTRPTELVTGNRLVQGFKECSRADYRNTDLGNVDRFTDVTKGNVRFVPALSQWIGWHTARWEAMPNAFEVGRYVARSIYAEAQQEVEDDKREKLIRWGLNSQQKPRLDAMISLAKQSHKVLLPDLSLDSSPKLLGVANGTVDLETGELLSPNRDRFITKSTGVTYDPQADCPRWKQFISEIMGGDVELIQFLHRLAGYALWGANPEQVVAILHGSGSNGKSTFVSVLQQVLGDYARQVDPTSLMARPGQSGGGPRDDLVRLYRARLAIAVESGEGDSLDEGLIKTVSGGDHIYARAMYAKQGIEFTPEFLLMLATNHKPVIKGTDYAIWRRLILIPFERSFKKDNRDRNLADQLNNERVGIIRWMVQGCMDWRVNGLSPPAKVRIATEEYRGEMDILGDWIEASCNEIQGAVTPTRDLYRNYKDWCESEGQRAFGNRWFGRNLANKGYTDKKTNGVRCRVGLQLNQVVQNYHFQGR